MLCARAMLIVVFSVGSGADDRKLADEKDQDRIQGVWRVVSSEKDGKPHEDTKDAKFVFAGDEITIELSGEKPSKGRFKLDPTKDPKWIDSGSLGRGVYHIEGDKLKICWGERRPAEFVSKKDVYLLQLKREKP
jgi:uncharacterized protein (TIGR03067 family)